MSAHFDDEGRKVVAKTEWMVETETTEDEFDNEREARDWLAECRRRPEWMTGRLMKRTVTTVTSQWERAK